MLDLIMLCLTVGGVKMVRVQLSLCSSSGGAWLWIACCSGYVHLLVYTRALQL